MYIVEGNIGAGKSTFLTFLEQQLTNTSVILEPVYDWQNKVYGQSLLANFYQDPQRWAYTFETLTMMCRTKEHLAQQEQTEPNRIFERSLYSGHYCFAKNSFESGFMTPLEWELYANWFSFLIPTKCQPPLGFIYLRTTPETCYTRIKKRNRSAETKLTLRYLQHIHARHDAFLLEKKNVLKQLKEVPVLTLDCNSDFQTSQSLFYNHLTKVQEFMIETQKKHILNKATKQKNSNRQ